MNSFSVLIQGWQQLSNRWKKLRISDIRALLRGLICLALANCLTCTDEKSCRNAYDGLLFWSCCYSYCYYPCANLSFFLQDFTFLLYTCLKNRQKFPIKKTLPKMDIADELLQGDTVQLLHSAHAKSIKHLSTDNYSWSEVFSCACDDFPACGSHSSGCRDLSAIRTVLLAGEGQTRLLVGTKVGSSLWVWGRCDADRMMRLGCSAAVRPHRVKCSIGSRWEYELESVAWSRWHSVWEGQQSTVLGSCSVEV